MDEIIVNQTKYISSKRASAATGYAKDYVGQLVRQGKIDARKVGRSWYVNERQILEHSGRVGQQRESVPIAEHTSFSQPLVTTKARITHPHQIESAIKKSWSDIKYYTDDGQVLPISDKRDESYSSEISIYKANYFDQQKNYPTQNKVVAGLSLHKDPVLASMRTVDGIQPQSTHGVVVLSRHVANPTKYVDAADFYREWRYKSILTVILAAAVALLVPVIL